MESQSFFSEIVSTQHTGGVSDLECIEQPCFGNSIECVHKNESFGIMRLSEKVTWLTAIFLTTAKFDENGLEKNVSPVGEMITSWRFLDGFA